MKETTWVDTETLLLCTTPTESSQTSAQWQLISEAARELPSLGLSYSASNAEVFGVAGEERANLIEELLAEYRDLWQSLARL